MNKKAKKKLSLEAFARKGGEARAKKYSKKQLSLWAAKGGRGNKKKK